MLVLSRKINESVNVGPDIVVAVLGRRGDRITLGIDAPREVEIRRSDLSPLWSSLTVEEKLVRLKRISDDAKVVWDSLRLAYNSVHPAAWGQNARQLLAEVAENPHLAIEPDTVERGEVLLAQFEDWRASVRHCAQRIAKVLIAEARS